MDRYKVVFFVNAPKKSGNNNGYLVQRIVRANSLMEVYRQAKELERKNRSVFLREIRGLD